MVKDCSTKITVHELQSYNNEHEKANKHTTLQTLKNTFFNQHFLEYNHDTENIFLYFTYHIKGNHIKETT